MKLFSILIYLSLPSGKLPPSQQSDLQGSHERNRQAAADVEMFGREQ
jgi:hypothetical protein